MSYTRRLRIEFSGEQTDLEVVLPDDATVATLADLLGASTEDLMVDGRVVPPWSTLADADVRDGAVIDLDQTPPVGRPAVAPVVALEKVAGCHGPVSRPLTPGTHEVPADADGSSAFALLVGDGGAVTVLPRSGPVVIDNVRITEPTPLGPEVLIVGGARYKVGPLQADDGGVDTTARPIRRHRGPVDTRRRVAPAVLPRLDGPTASNGWLWPVPVVVLLGVLGIVSHPLFFVGAALALALSFGLLLRARQSSVAARSAVRAETVATIENFSRHVARERRSVAEALRGEHPSTADLVRRAAARQGFRLRHEDEHDFGRVAIGYGDLPWSIEVESDFVLDPAIQTVVDRNDVLASVPIHIDLTAGPIGIVGPRAQRLAIARTIAVEVCSRWSAADVRFAIATEATDLDDWGWGKWAPHLDETRHVATSLAAADRMVSSWRTPGHDWLQLVFVDQPKWMADEGSLLQVITGEPERQCLVVLADTIDELPWCDTLVELEADGTIGVRGPDADPARFVSPRHTPVSAADVILRAAAAGQPDPASSPDPDGPHGVRPFQLEADARPEAPAVTLAPPPVPPPAAPAADPVKPTVIRAAATDDAMDGAALTPPSVPDPPADSVSPDDAEDDVIDLREPMPPSADSASDEPGTRWTRSRR